MIDCSLASSFRSCLLACWVWWFCLFLFELFVASFRAWRIRGSAREFSGIFRDKGSLLDCLFFLGPPPREPHRAQDGEKPFFSKKKNKKTKTKRTTTVTVNSVSQFLLRFIFSSDFFHVTSNLRRKGTWLGMLTLKHARLKFFVAV